MRPGRPVTSVYFVVWCGVSGWKGKERVVWCGVSGWAGREFSSVWCGMLQKGARVERVV
jgi:hypothetical protein